MTGIAVDPVDHSVLAAPGAYLGLKGRTFTVDPNDSNVVYGTAGAATWIPPNRGLADLDVTGLAMDPRSPNTVYAATASLSVFRLEGARIGRTFVPFCYSQIQCSFSRSKVGAAKCRESRDDQSVTREPVGLYVLVLENNPLRWRRRRLQPSGRRGVHTGVQG